MSTLTSGIGIVPVLLPGVELYRGVGRIVIAVVIGSTLSR